MMMIVMIMMMTTITVTVIAIVMALIRTIVKTPQHFGLTADLKWRCFEGTHLKSVSGLWRQEGELGGDL